MRNQEFLDWNGILGFDTGFPVLRVRRDHCGNDVLVVRMRIVDCNVVVGFEYWVPGTTRTARYRGNDIWALE